MVEALAAGTPVIALDAGGARDIVRADVDGVLIERPELGELQGGRPRRGATLMGSADAPQPGARVLGRPLPRADARLARRDLGRGPRSACPVGRVTGPPLSRIGIDARNDQAGIGRYTSSLIRELAQIDRENEYVLFLSRDRFASYAAPRTNFRAVEAEIPWFTVREQLQLPRLVARERLDLMHYPHLTVPLATRTPFVVTVHDLNYLDAAADSGSRLRRAGYRVELAKARRARRLIAVSKHTRDTVVRELRVDPEQIAVTYEAADPPGAVEPDASVLARLGLDSPFFLYVGAAYPYKNLARLIDAFARLSGDHKLVLAGDQEDFGPALRSHASGCRSRRTRRLSRPGLRRRARSPLRRSARVRLRLPLRGFRPARPRGDERGVAGRGGERREPAGDLRRRRAVLRPARRRLDRRCARRGGGRRAAAEPSRRARPGAGRRVLVAEDGGADPRRLPRSAPTLTAMSAAASVGDPAPARRRLTLETAVRPHTLLLVGVGLSLLAWAIPWGGAIPSLVAGLFTRGAVDPLGHALHRRLVRVLLRSGVRRLPPRPEDPGARAGGPRAVAELLRLPQPRQLRRNRVLVRVRLRQVSARVLQRDPPPPVQPLRYALPYSAGFQTLRYAASLSGAIAIFELCLRRFRVLHLVNLVLLLSAAALASRITLIIAAITVAGLAARHLHAAHVRGATDRGDAPARRGRVVPRPEPAQLFAQRGLLPLARRPRPARHERRGDGPLSRDPVPGGGRGEQPRDVMARDPG